MSLDFPELDEPVAAPAAAKTTAVAAAAADLAKVDLKAVALAQFGDWRTDVANATATLTGVEHDLSTGTKLTEAKALRQRLINAPLAAARKVSSAVKSRLTSVGRDVGTELEKLEAAYGEVDKLITPQIEARERELAEERRIKQEKEEARVQKHRDNLAALARPAERARDEPGMTAERIANGIAAVTAIVIDRAAWEEFADRAEEQKAVTLERMQALHAAAVASEEAARVAAEQAAQLKAQQEEAARVAAAQAAEAKRLADAAAALAAQQAAFAAQQEAARIAALPPAPAPEPAPAPQITQDAKESGFVAETSAPCVSNEAEPAQASPSESGAAVQAEESTASSVATSAVVYGYVGRARVEPAPEAPTLMLGELWKRLGLDDREAFLASLGFPSTPAPKGTGKLYRASDVPAIRRAIAVRMNEAADFLDGEA